MKSFKLFTRIVLVAMKTNISLTMFRLLIIFVLLSFESCCNISIFPENKPMPPETQSGKQTLGCYVNDELFVNNNRYVFIAPSVMAEFNRERHKLSIYSVAKLGEVGLGDTVLEINKLHKLESATFRYRQDGYSFVMQHNDGEIFLTRFDTINRVVSGTFSFRATYSDYMGIPICDSTVQITQGRFDIKLEELW